MEVWFAYVSTPSFIIFSFNHHGIPETRKGQRIWGNYNEVTRNVSWNSHSVRRSGANNHYFTSVLLKGRKQVWIEEGNEKKIIRLIKIYRYVRRTRMNSLTGEEIRLSNLNSFVIMWQTQSYTQLWLYCEINEIKKINYRVFMHALFIA